MIQKTKKRFFSIFVAFSVYSFATVQTNAKANESSSWIYTQRNILTQTLEVSFGMQGFEAEHELGEPNEIVEIIVQFRTPPAVALRLLQEGVGFVLEDLPVITFENQALSAHEDFQNQLGSLFVPDNFPSPEIFSEHHSLFNGVFMRVPAVMVPQIASLPEVFVVTPVVNFYPSYQIEEEHEHEFFPEMWISDVEALLEIESLFANENFMRATRDFLNMDYIHNELGITGAGIRVAVLDTGIYHDHPEFARFLDNTNRIRGWHRADNSHVGNDAHGTTVSGAVIGIAPGVELWHYRVLGSGGSPIHPITAIEYAHSDGAQVINMSFGAPAINHPFDAFASAINLAVLDGVVVVASAGNQGASGSFTVTSPGPEPLLITVAAGHAGGVHTGDILRSYSSLGPVARTYHIKPDITATTGVVSTNIGGGYTSASGGTSHASPIVAAVAALLLEAFPYAEPWEIKARIMNTARPLEDMNPNSVFAVGAGFIQPLEALTQNGQSFASVEHPVPFLSNVNAPFVNMPMASLSYGRFYGDSTPPMKITIHNYGNNIWTPQVRFNGEHTGVSLMLRPLGSGEFVSRLAFSDDAVPGVYEGDLIFTSGTQQITMPFATVFDGGGVAYTLGDINRDGVVNLIDLVLLELYLQNIQSPGVQFDLLAADVTQENILDSEDFRILKMYVLGIYTSLP